MATSSASRPRPMSTRPTRPVPFRGSNVHHRPPRHTSCSGRHLGVGVEPDHRPPRRQGHPATDVAEPIDVGPGGRGGLFVPRSIDHAEGAVGAGFGLQHRVRGHRGPLHEFASHMPQHRATVPAPLSPSGLRCETNMNRRAPDAQPRGGGIIQMTPACPMPIRGHPPND